jgi:hypothetical protein
LFVQEIKMNSPKPFHQGTPLDSKEAYKLETKTKALTWSFLLFEGLITVSCKMSFSPKTLEHTVSLTSVDNKHPKYY